MTPVHLPEVADERAALAPYNFVPLPEQVVLAEDQEPLDQSVYHAERFTGRIVCTLITASPLFVRCGLTPEQLAAGQEAKALPEFFFTEAPDMPVIPGSSLRGMLRALVEIAAYGKLDRVTDRPRFFFRAVAAPREDLLQEPYSKAMGNFGRNVVAGYLEREGNDWYIRPAKRVQSLAFIKVKEWDKKTGRQIIPETLVYKRLKEEGYAPQYVPCTFTIRRGQRGIMVDQIGPPGAVKGGIEGVMVTSGNMLETDQAGRRGRLERTSHTIVSKETEQTRLPISPQAVEDYRASLTEFQKSPPFDEQWGALVVGRPIFYLEPGRGEREVSAFGHSPNFRLPFRFPDSARAASPRDFVPEELRRDAITDLAEAIFGFVRGSRKGTQQEQARAGRVFVGDAVLEPGQDDVWLSERPFTPHILGSPKPTTFQHYLVQPGGARRELKHYASRPGEETAVRGHKLYWHKGSNPALALPPEKLQKVNDTQTTTLRPVRAEVSFRFTVHVENLSQVELGALLWVLRLGSDPAYCLKLGMGKPLGMGAVRLKHQLFTSQRAERYAQLFDGAGWASGEARLSDEDQDAAVDAFEAYVLKHSGEGEHYPSLRDTLRMRCLLALLSWPGPLPEQTRYLEIERPVREGFISAAQQVRYNDPTVNEYKDRPVLPLPTQVAELVLSEADLERYRAQATASERRPEAARPPRGEPARPEQATPPLPPPIPAAPQIPAVGEVFTGKIKEMDTSAAVIEVPDFAPDQALALLSADVANLRRYRVGNAARVEVVEQKTQRSGRVLLVVKPAPPKPKQDAG